MVPCVTAVGHVWRKPAEMGVGRAHGDPHTPLQTEGRVGGKGRARGNGEDSIVTREEKIVLGASFIPIIYIPRIPNRSTSKHRNEMGGW